MKQPVILIGVGEMGGVFARGLLRLGHPVFPVTRDTDINALAARLPDLAMVLVAVGENALKSVLAGLPPAWCDKAALLQNELLPADFADLSDPTVISVWFEKKPGQDAKVIIPSPVYGPRAQLLRDALGAIDIPARVLQSPDELLFELVVKNLYILTSNIAGLKVGGTVGELSTTHGDFCGAVTADVIALQEAMTGTRFDHDALVRAMLAAFAGDPDHKCMGRSAPARLQRALENAERLGIEVPTLRSIAADQ